MLNVHKDRIEMLILINIVSLPNTRTKAEEAEQYLFARRPLEQAFCQGVLQNLKKLVFRL